MASSRKCAPGPGFTNPRPWDFSANRRSRGNPALGLVGLLASVCFPIDDDASNGPFDGAVCLLTLHFLEKNERLRTLKEIHRRLKPGAPFIAAHTCLPENPDARTLWLDRYAANALASGAPVEMVTKAREAVGKMSCLYPNEVDMALIAEAGFETVELFYAALTWRGWISYA